MPCCFATRRTLAQVRAGTVEATNSSDGEVGAFESKILAVIITHPALAGNGNLGDDQAPNQTSLEYQNQQGN